jgi:F1F0 ATPase subunit 2
MMQALGLGAWLTTGVAVGVAYFVGVWWSARQFAAGGRVTTTIALAFGRLVLLGGLLMLASLRGALPLLMMALGIVVARFGVVRRLGGLT